VLACGKTENQGGARWPLLRKAETQTRGTTGFPQQFAALDGPNLLCADDGKFIDSTGDALELKGPGLTIRRPGFMSEARALTSAP
jgi:hypothetical protein